MRLTTNQSNRHLLPATKSVDQHHPLISVNDTISERSSRAAEAPRCFQAMRHPNVLKASMNIGIINLHMLAA